MTNGGPAFPVPMNDFRDLDLHPARGMTLRDWFAGQALPTVASWTPQDQALTEASANQVAEKCGMIADAMLREREAKR